MKTISADLLIPEDKSEPKLISLGISIGITVVLIFTFIFWIIHVPNPPLPPAPESMEIEFIDLNIGSGAGENSTNPGGASEGNSGEAGSVAQEQPIPNPNPTPPANGAITGNEVDNPTATTAPQPSDALKNALAQFNQKKGKAVINVTGGGQGNDPYGGGIGGKGGNGDGKGEGSPGFNGPGPGGEGGKGSGGVRKLLSKPDVKNPTLEEGVVAIDVYVNKEGKVVRADVNSARSTTINSILRATARQEAQNLKFSADSNAPNQVLLTIEFNFTLK
jgi:hypothetical protein